MKRLALFLTLAVTACASASLWAQAKPKLTQINFYDVASQKITCSGGGAVTVELLFDQNMSNAASPTIKYGRNGNYNLTLPLNGKWENEKLFQGSFTVTPNVPSEPDGEYRFLIFGAQSAASVLMDSTYSDSLKQALSIYRNANVIAGNDTIDFGVLTFGKSKRDSVYLTFAGCNNVTINSATLLNTAHFALLNNLAGTLQKGDTLFAQLRYQPASRLAHQTKLRVIYTVSAKLDTVEVVLRGRAKGPQIKFVPPASLNFGVLSVNNPLTRYALVFNAPAQEAASSDTLRITSLTSSLPAIFAVNQKQLPLILAPADTDTVRVTFTPAAAITYNESLTFATNDSSQPAGNLAIPMSGRGNINQPPDSIRAFTGNWSGGNAGYTSLDSLFICLTNNPSGVAFARVKFTQSTNDPPLNPNDFTGSSAPFVRNGVLCFYVPLRGVISSGRWNCYLWLDGTNGASGFARAAYASITYDNTAPVINSLNVTSPWPGGFPYITNAASLSVCWSTEDVSGISEVRWKFVPTPGAPTSNTDTQNGGTFKGNGLTCATIPLSQLGNNRWYCYVWLVDRSGNSGFANAVQSVLRIDRKIPGRPGAPTARTIPATTWFGANQILGLTLTLPDTARDAARVRWKFKTPPAANTIPDGEAALVRSGNTASFNVLFNNAALCGDDSLYYWVADSAGNVSALNNSFARYRFDMCPPAITRIASLNNNVALIGQAFRDRILIRDPDSGVDTVWVNYRFGGANVEEPALAARRVANTDTFLFDIPVAGVTKRGVEYRVTARDLIPNEGRGPSNEIGCNTDGYNWYPIRARATGEGDFRIDQDGRAVPLISGADSTFYQLVSIPYQTDNTSNAANALQDDLGAYDKTQWRLFDYHPENALATRWAEGASARPFAPGRSFFLITRQANIVLDSGPANTRRTVCSDTLTLYEGWNLIATPFNFPVHRESMSLLNSNTLLSLRSFERGWDISDVMDPWRGYALYVTRASGSNSEAPIRLVVKPIAVPGRIGKESAQPFALQTNEWAVKIAAHAGEVHDRDNWAGVRMSAQSGFDELELAEPPVIGGYVALSFSRPEWQQPAQHFSTDFRPSHEEEQAWEFEVRTNQTHANVRLSFDLLGDLPAAAQVYLIDEALGLAQNLRANAEYVFRTGAAPAQKKLKLIVGSEQFAAKQAGEIALVPEKFEVLQNFPNPFNPETSIRYNLPEAASVSVVIYDQLGRRVRTLLENVTQQAGYQNILWDGRDAAGKQVATGVYLYKITAGKQALVRKMLLAK